MQQFNSKATNAEKAAFAQMEATCCVCGRTFFKAPQHMYKASVSTYVNSSAKSHRSETVWFCRYNCYVKWMKEHGRW